MKKIIEDAPTNCMGNGAIADPKNKLLGKKKVNTELIKRWMGKNVLPS